jgi:hypothetical protein
VRFNPARLNENPVELQPSTPCILLCDKAVKLSNSNLIRARVMSNPLIVTCLWEELDHSLMQVLVMCIAWLLFEPTKWYFILLYFLDA